MTGPSGKSGSSHITLHVSPRIRGDTHGGTYTCIYIYMFILELAPWLSQTESLTCGVISDLMSEMGKRSETP